MSFQSLTCSLSEARCCRETPEWQKAVRKLEALFADALRKLLANAELCCAELKAKQVQVSTAGCAAHVQCSWWQAVSNLLQRSDMLYGPVAMHCDAVQ